MYNNNSKYSKPLKKDDDSVYPDIDVHGDAIDSWLDVCQETLDLIEVARKERMELAESIYGKGILDGTFQVGKFQNFEDFVSHAGNHFSQYVRMHGQYAYSAKQRIIRTYQGSLKLAAKYGGSVAIKSDLQKTIIVLADPEIRKKIDKKYYAECDALATRSNQKSSKHWTDDSSLGGMG